ncbi:hypothetical protein L3X38_029607 [Prunus dulcis]|uniref:Uncharacterized protein n=1 Tax=Prunus dulcis TaxID=3755 RepID=A0AAD4VRY9_PRUDU|nr:hypothetical protein L3X38_029607 [Prunus dulcis]
MLRKISSVHLFSGKALDDLRHVRQEEVAVLAHGLAGAGSKDSELGSASKCMHGQRPRAGDGGEELFGDGSGSGDEKATSSRRWLWR